MTAITQADREDIQGIILSGFGHLFYTTYLLLAIAERDRARDWLRRVIPEVITAKLWGKNPDGTTAKPEVTFNLAFTHLGLAAIGLVDKALNTFPREFTEGMAEPKRAEILGDTGASAPDQWEFGRPNGTPLHLIVILHGSSPERLNAYRQQLLDGFDTGLTLVSEETGFRVPTFKEHFGFNDSVSQPEIEGVQKPSSNPRNRIATGEMILGYPDGYGILPIVPVVPPEVDPHNLLPAFPGNELPHLKDFGHNGSFLVYRKLAQDVAGFWRYIAARTRDSQGTPDSETMTLIASNFVGRWPSGTPLTLYPDRDNPQLEDKNTFSYLPHDADGLRCPMGAHIRRTHPRDSLLDDLGEGSFLTSSRHRVLRRGSLFGKPLFPLDDIEAGKLPLDIEDDGQLRGLHFFCLNADIGRQFEFVQQTWTNNPRFNGLYDNKDPIIGDNDGTGNMTIPRCPVRKRLLNLPRFVTMRGGAYFFLPSVRSLQFLVTSS
jgi:Dyp-type peroxidase family